jgi:hypothetical protein
MPAFSRNISIEMDWIGGSSFEIRGTLSDNVHALSARLIVSFPDFIIREAEGQISRMPYPGFCQGAAAALSKLVGQVIARGFRKRLNELLGGAESCNHLHALIADMAACAFQMNYIAAKRDPQLAQLINDIGEDYRRRREFVLRQMPQLRDSCYVFSRANDRLFEQSGGDSNQRGD